MKSIVTCLVLLLSNVSLFSQKSKKLEQLFATYDQAGLFSGSVLIAEKGKIIFEKSYGYRNAPKKRKIQITAFIGFTLLLKCLLQPLFFSWQNKENYL